MSYWKEVRELIKKGADIAAENIRQSAENTAQNIRQGAENAAEKTKEAANIAKAKAQIFLKHRDLVDIFTDLGELLYNEYNNKKPTEKLDFFSNPEYTSLIKKADAIVEECSKLAKEAGIDEDEFSHKK